MIGTPLQFIATCVYIALDILSAAAIHFGDQYFIE